MYADDTTIYFNLEDFDSQNTEADINAELEKVNTCLKLNKLSLNAQKPKLMLFHRKQKHVNDVNIKIDNTMIEHCCVWTIILLYTCITTINHSLCIDESLLLFPLLHATIDECSTCL